MSNRWMKERVANIHDSIAVEDSWAGILRDLLTTLQNIGLSEKFTGAAFTSCLYIYTHMSYDANEVNCVVTRSKWPVAKAKRLLWQRRTLRMRAAAADETGKTEPNTSQNKSSDSRPNRRLTEISSLHSHGLLKSFLMSSIVASIPGNAMKRKRWRGPRVSVCDDSFAWGQQAAAVILNELQGSFRKEGSRVLRTEMRCKLEMSGLCEKHVGKSEALQLREWWRQVEVDAGLDTKQAHAQECCISIFLVRRNINIAAHPIVN